MNRLARSFPILDWGRRYGRAEAGADASAAVIVTIMLIPQSLAYALIAGLPPEAGLYASIAPLALYALFGTSSALAVGPVAVASLMTAAAIGQVAAVGTAGYAAAALMLAALSGAMLLAMGVLRLGFLANYLGHPVISGFITASAILIAVGQARHLLGVTAGGHDLPHLVLSLVEALPQTNPPTLILGAAALAFLWWSRAGLRPALEAVGLPPKSAAALSRAAPAAAVAATTLAAWSLDLGASGVALAGAVPAGLPPLTLPPLDLGLARALFIPALLISLVGFVESVSVAQTLAAKRRERIEPNQELLGLGAANLGAAATGGFPVTGGFSRSVVNFDAGARTPMAGVFTAAGIALVTLTLSPLLAFLPKATLAATIIVAVLGLTDFAFPRRLWRYSKGDFSAWAATVSLTLLMGVEAGVAAGLALSLLIHLHRTSNPHAAVVGQVPGSEHFRNVERHAVVTDPAVLTLRVDESLYFPNARWLEDRVAAAVADHPDLRHVVLMCPAVNFIDASALESLEAIDRRLAEAGVTLHLSEVKGPVMDRLHRAEFLDHLSGDVFLSQADAFAALAPDAAAKALTATRKEADRLPYASR